VLRSLVLGAFVVTAAVIVTVAAQVVLSATGVRFDPHGWGVIFGIVAMAVLTPVALALWLLYRWMRRPPP
jgi:uncharacterized BrkB/YihY/UPF0761 family membrane protein